MRSTLTCSANTLSNAATSTSSGMSVLSADGDDRRRADRQRRPSGQRGRHQDHPSGAALPDGRAHRLVLGEPVVVGARRRRPPSIPAGRFAR